MLTRIGALRVSVLRRRAAKGRESRPGKRSLDATPGFRSSELFGEVICGLPHSTRESPSSRERATWQNVIKVAAARAAFGLVHSAPWPAGQPSIGVAYLFGQRGRNSFYRPFYLAQSVVTFGVLVAYIRQLPDRELYY
jgi:hypothetical protein